MINGIQLSFFSNYIYSPQTYFHTISVRYKILIMSIYLIIIPHLPLWIFSNITISILCLFIFLAHINDSFDIYNILLTLIIYWILLFLVTNISPIYTHYLMIIIPYNIKLQWIKTNLYNLQILHYYSVLTLSISSLITRMFLLLTSYYLGYQLIMLTTQVEDIFIHNLYTLHYISRARYILVSFIPDLIFIIILSYEYISLIENTITNTITSMTLRGQSLNIFKNYNELLQIFTLIFEVIHIQLNHEIYTTNNIIHSRELYMSSKQKWLIRLDS